VSGGSKAVKASSMITVIGYYLSSAVALAITFIGLRFFITPYSAAAGYGVAVEANAQWDAYLSVKAVRDIASGLFTAILILNRSAHLLGWFMLVATIIPFADAVIVVRHGGQKATAFGIHGATAGVMLIISGLLLLG